MKYLLLIISLNVYAESYELTPEERELLLQAYKAQAVEVYDAKKEWPACINDDAVVVQPVVKAIPVVQPVVKTVSVVQPKK
jgi:hypothetical protein